MYRTIQEIEQEIKDVTIALDDCITSWERQYTQGYLDNLEIELNETFLHLYQTA